MRFELKFNCDNAAFEDYPEAEISRILKDLALKVQNQEYTGKYQNIKDVNGNIVGTFKLSRGH